MMDKESVGALQKIDCNCNNCIFMHRDMARHEQSKHLHYLWQMQYFVTMLNKKIRRAIWWASEGGSVKKAERIFKQAADMKFQKEETAVINYGQCQYFKKPVSFIPDTCQLHTQTCFVHRSEINKQK